VRYCNGAGLAVFDILFAGHAREKPSGVRYSSAGFGVAKWPHDDFCGWWHGPNRVLPVNLREGRESFGRARRMTRKGVRSERAFAMPPVSRYA